MSTNRIVMPRTFVQGTPRGYGGETGIKWLGRVKKSLLEQLGPMEPVKQDVACIVELEFVLVPESKEYGGQNGQFGTDLDNLIKQTVDALSHNERAKRHGLGVIPDDRQIAQIVATKKAVKTDGQMGVWITIRAGENGLHTVDDEIAP